MTETKTESDTRHQFQLPIRALESLERPVITVRTGLGNTIPKGATDHVCPGR